jgi:hypothetical protein
MSAHWLLRSVAVVVLVLIGSHAEAQLVNSEWNVGSGDWNVATNWFPNDVPDNGGGFTYNVQIGNRPVAAGAVVTFIPEDGGADTIETLTISGGADFFTNGNQLNVNGLTTITGASSTIRLDAHAVLGTPALQTGDLDVTGGGSLSMNGGVASIFSDMDVTGTGTINGRGTLIVGDLDLVVEQAFQNSGFIQVSGSLDSVGTLTIQANGVDTIDLDGDSEVGIVDVSNAFADLEADTLTLIIDGPLSDGLGAAAGGALEIGQRDTVTFNDNFEIDAGYTITMNGGNNVATLNGPGSITDIAGAAFNITGDAVITNNMAFTGTANVVTVNANSSLTLGGTVTMTDASSLSLTSSSELIITGNSAVNEVAGDFNWDGPGVATTTISGTGQLSLTVNRVDTTDDVYGGTLNLNDNGDLSVNNVANAWTLAGVMNKNNAGTSTVSGDRILVTGVVNANAGTLDMPAVTLSAGADVHVAGTLSLGGGTEFAGPAALDGAGTVRMEGNSTTSANTTISVATFDWDGASVGGVHTINAGAALTINSATFDGDGDMDDAFTLAGNGSQLIVNNTNGLAQWTAVGTLTANSSGAGTATIGGTSRMIAAGLINVDGNTNISAPVTFNRAGLVADIDAGMTLDVTSSATNYGNGTIDGAGTFDPGISNTVTGDFTINPDGFDFDGGSWTIQSGAELTFNVVDYEPDAVTNSFENTITINSGRLFANSPDPTFVMNGTLNMNSAGGVGAEWAGDAVDLGNDGGVLDANLNVTGDGNPNSQGRFLSAVNFKSDADVDVPAGAFLNLVGVVNFDTVNAANNAEFTGAGTMAFGNVVNVNEAATLNMVGGSVDLDGNDATGEFVNVDAPLTINAATLSNFGRVNGGGGTNTLDVNNSVGTGVLTVNLDDPNGEWTLNGPGVMNLVNDNVDATLLAGSDVNVDGTLNVTGDVRTTARLDVAGVVNINTAGQPLRLAGGNNTNDMNTIAGGNISGAGILAADTGKGLSGHGTINTSIDFDGTADLVASGGTLSFSNFIIDVNTIRTSGAAAVFNFLQPVTTNVTDDGILMEGGTIQGAELTVAALSKPLRGTGTVTNRIVNNGLIEATVGDLTLQTAGNNNDWDGLFDSGVLSAINGSTLELRDVGAPFVFGGALTAGGFGRVYASGFGIDFNPGSSITLTQGTFEADESTDVSGTVTVNAGAGSIIKVQNNRFLSFETGSATTLNANLQLQNNNIIIEDGATFSGPGALVIPDGSHMVAENLANIGVLLDMQGAFRPGNSEGIGRVNLFDYQQASSAELFVELRGTALNAFDRLVASGDVVVDGFLSIDIDDVSPGVPFVPALGQTFNIITGNAVTGTFDTVDVSGMPAGLAFHVEYLANAVQLQVVNKPLFSADFDDDGDVDATDLAIWKGAFNLNQLGDADGDNDSDGADFMLWQQQFGSAPAVAAAQPWGAPVPEPSAALLLLTASALLYRRRPIGVLT